MAAVGVGTVFLQDNTGIPKAYDASNIIVSGQQGNRGVVLAADGDLVAATTSRPDASFVLRPKLSGWGTSMSNNYELVDVKAAGKDHPLMAALLAPGQQSYGNVATYNVNLYDPQASFGVSGEARVPLVMSQAPAPVPIRIPSGQPQTLTSAALLQWNIEHPNSYAPMYTGVYGGQKPASWSASPITWGRVRSAHSYF